MTPTQKHQAELTKICTSLREAITATPEECRQIVGQVLRRAERLAESIAAAPAKLGAKGGKQTALRGSQWFRELALKRKTHGGGRPKKERSEG
jgi:hypothetical protein